MHHAIRQGGAEGGHARIADPRHEQPPVPLEDRARDLDELVRLLPLAEDDLREAAAQLALRVEARVTEVVQREMVQAAEGLLDRRRAALHLEQQLFQPAPVQRAREDSSVGLRV